MVPLKIGVPDYETGDFEFILKRLRVISFPTCFVSHHKNINPCEKSIIFGIGALQKRNEKRKIIKTSGLFQWIQILLSLSGHLRFKSLSAQRKCWAFNRVSPYTRHTVSLMSIELEIIWKLCGCLVIFRWTVESLFLILSLSYQDLCDYPI